MEFLYSGSLIGRRSYREVLYSKVLIGKRFYREGVL